MRGVPLGDVSTGMTRGRLAGLLVVLVLLAAALVVGARNRLPASPAASTSATTLTPALLAARTAAALPACPPGLTIDLPAMRLPCMAGGADVSASAPPGRPTLVNLWATWCGPCVAEVPELVQFAAEAGERVGVVGVATEDSPDSVYAFAKAFGINYPLVRDDLGDVLRHYGSGVPKTLLVTADGQVAHVQVGEFPTLGAVEDAVAAHLGVRV